MNKTIKLMNVAVYLGVCLLLTMMVFAYAGATSQGTEQTVQPVPAGPPPAMGPPPVNYSSWFILTVCLLLVVVFTIKIMRSKPKGLATAAPLSAPSWIGPLNSTNMVFGPIAMLFGGFLALFGGINIVSILAAVLLFFGGLTGKRYFRLQPASTRRSALATNVIAALLGSIAVLGHNALISKHISSNDQGVAMVLGVGLPALPVIMSIITVVVIVRQAKSQS